MTMKIEANRFFLDGAFQCWIAEVELDEVFNQDGVVVAQGNTQDDAVSQLKQDVRRELELVFEEAKVVVKGDDRWISEVVNGERRLRREKK